MFELAKLAGFLLSPLTLTLALGAMAGLLLLARWRRLAVAAAATAFTLLWLASTPMAAQSLVLSLESRFPAVSVQATPAADAIVVLGGALVGAQPPRRPTFNLGPASSRIWHAAALYRAGKAKWIIVAAGNQPGSHGQQIEAEAIAHMLEDLQVPKAAIRQETLSRNTRENAAFTRPLAEQLGVRRVLLVTSASHMPRALLTFEQEWSGLGVTFFAATADVGVTVAKNSPEMWIPDASALVYVTKALKEYAGLLALAII